MWTAVLHGLDRLSARNLPPLHLPESTGESLRFPFPFWEKQDWKSIWTAMACKGASLDKSRLSSLRVLKQKLLFLIAQHHPLALWRCLCVPEPAQENTVTDGLLCWSLQLPVVRSPDLPSPALHQLGSDFPSPLEAAQQWLAAIFLSSCGGS